MTCQNSSSSSTTTTVIIATSPSASPSGTESHNSSSLDLSISPIGGSGAHDVPFSSSVPAHLAANDSDLDVGIIRIPTNVEPYGPRMQRSTRELSVSTFFNSYLHKISKCLNIKLDNRYLAVGPEFHCCDSYGEVDLALAVSPFEDAQVRDSFPVWLHESKPASTTNSGVISRFIYDNSKRNEMGQQLMQRLHNTVFWEELQTYHQRYLVGSSGCGSLVALWMYSVHSGITYRIIPSPDGEPVEEILKRSVAENITYPAAFWNYDAFRQCGVEEAFSFAAKSVLLSLVDLKKCPPDHSLNVEHSVAVIDESESSDAESEDSEEY